MQLALGLRTYDVTSRALVMGVLHAFPAPSPQGVGSLDLDGCVQRAERMVVDGADLLDVGAAEAAEPGGGFAESEELDVLVSLVDALHQRLDVPLSCATNRASVARAAYAGGAVMGNDASGFSDPDYLPAAAEAGVSVVAAHAGLGPGAPGPIAPIHDVVAEVRTSLAELARRTEKAGLAPERIVLDPGLDAARTPEQSLQLLRASPALADLGHPLLLSMSHRLLTALLGHRVDDRRATAVAVSALGIVGGARVLRAEDVRTARRVADVLAAILAA